MRRPFPDSGRIVFCVSCGGFSFGACVASLLGLCVCVASFLGLCFCDKQVGCFGHFPDVWERVCITLGVVRITLGVLFVTSGLELCFGAILGPLLVSTRCMSFGFGHTTTGMPSMASAVLIELIVVGGTTAQ